MKIQKCKARVDSANCVLECVEYQHKVWLIGGWDENLGEKWTAPTRIICVQALDLRKATAADRADYVLNTPLPRSIFHGAVPRQLARRVEVVESPPLRAKKSQLH